jgi:hypothetical protein
MPRFIILLGLVLVAFGLAWALAEKFGLGRLPGDIVIERDGMRIYIPITTSLLISAVLSAVFWLLNR